MSSTVLRDIGHALGGLFGAGKLDDDRKATLEVLFGLLGHVAKLDSLITSHEAEFINDLMDELKLTMKERKIAAAALRRRRSTHWLTRGFGSRTSTWRSSARRRGLL